MAKTVRKTSIKDSSFTIKGTLWIETKGQRFFGPGPVELLERIHATGSINKAAKQMQMSYKKAWEIISMLNDGTKNPFVITQTGGSAGGGSVVTEEAQQMIAWYHDSRARFERFLQTESEKMNSSFPG